MCKADFKEQSVLIRNLPLIFVSSIFIWLGTYLHGALHDFEFFGKEIVPIFVSELGVAGLIAVALIFTIEQRSKDLERKENSARMDALGENLLKAVYKQNIQDSVFAIIESSVLKAKVCRENHRVKYTLNAIDSEKDDAIDEYKHVECFVRTSYELINTSNEVVQHEIIVTHERPYDDKWDESVQMSLLSVVRGAIEREVEDLTGKVKRVVHEKQIAFSSVVKLGPHEQVSVTTESELIKRCEDNEAWASFLPSDGIELLVVVPGDGLEVSAVAQHPVQLTMLSEGPNIWEWELKSGIFPYQSINFWWCPRKQRTNQ